MDGFLNLNKPPGVTSHDCVAQVRRILRLKRVGHGGTLDPAATGVLPIAVGRATRLLQYLPTGKAYRAVIRFGVTTTTDDLEGEVLTETPASTLEHATVMATLPRFQGTIQQIPPRYSAIQVQGKRLYDLARSGEIVEAPVRTVEVKQIEVLGWHPGEFPEVEVAIACGAGTYIRAIARDLGAALGVGGTLAALLRTESSGFSLSSSLTLDEFAAQVEHQTFHPTPPVVALSHLPFVKLTEAETIRWCQGQRIPYIKAAVPHSLLRVQDGSDRFLGIGKIVFLDQDCVLVPELVFQPLR